jgi:hypothetical protein
MSDQKDIRIFCPVHEASFEVANAPKILCEITGHTLSSDFPNAEFWEYCCTCDTFSPSRLDKGEKATAVCFSCQNEISRRFICAHCKTVSFVSDKSAKGQTYVISEQGVEPSCPGCGTPKQGRAMIRHDCSEAEAAFLTGRETCPFCLEKTSVGSVQPTQPYVPANTGACPNCDAINPPSAVFCGKCKYHLRPDIEVANPGSDISKTQALGSLCPNCSTPVRPGFPFCGECGQAVKIPGEFPPPPPPPPSPHTPKESAAVANTPQLYPDPDSQTTISPGKMTGYIAGGLGILALVIIVAFSLTNRGPGTSGNFANTTPTQRPTPAITGTPNNSKSNSLIGKTGKLVLDMNLRDVPGATELSIKVGTQYKDARLRILDVDTAVDSKGRMFDWYKVQITAFGKSMDPRNGDLPKDPGSLDVGWIHSYPNISKNSTEQRINSVDFDR